MIGADVDTKKFLRDLSRIQGGLHQASARTANAMGELTQNRYNKLIRTDFHIRTKFTLKSLRMFRASYRRKSKPGALRPLRDINVLLFIQNIRGKIHYLVIQEEGLDKERHRSANETVSMPIASSARKGGTESGRVAPRMTLRKSSPKTLQIGKSAADFGTTRDGYSDNQRWAILKKYQKKNPYNWDLKKPFQFAYGGDTDAYMQIGRGVKMIRQMRDKNRKVKRRPNYDEAFNMLSEAETQQIFNKIAERILR